MRFYYTIIYIICFCAICVAQNSSSLFEIESQLKTIDNTDINTVYQTVFDANGKAYLATSKGIVIFNGKKALLLTKNNGLPDNEIFNLKLKDSTLIFLPLKGGVYGLHLNNLNKNFKIIENERVLKDILIKNDSTYFSSYGLIFKEKKDILNVIWKYTWNNSLDIFNNDFYFTEGDHYLKFNIPSFTIDTILKNITNFSAFYVNDKTVYYKNENKLCVKNNLTKKIDVYLLENKALSLISIRPINDSLLFLITDKELLTFNTQTKKTETIIENTIVNNISYNEISNNYFISTKNKGLIILKFCKQENKQEIAFEKNVTFFKYDNKNTIYGFGNGEVIINKTTFKTQLGAINTIQKNENFTFIGSNKGFEIIHNNKHYTNHLFNSIKKSIITDSFVYIATSRNFVKINLYNLRSSTLIKKKHRSYYLQRHNDFLYTQSYNTDSLISIKLPSDELKYIGKLKGQIIKSIGKNGIVYFLTDIGYLYYLKNNTLSEVYVSKELNYPINNYSIFDFYKNSIIIGNNQACTYILTADLNENKNYFKSLFLKLPNDASFVNFNENYVNYISNNSLFNKKLKSEIYDKEFYFLHKTQEHISVERPNLLSPSFGKCNLVFETINYSSNHEVLTYYIIKPNLKISKHTTQNLDIEIDSLPIGKNYIVCFATNAKLSSSNKVILPIVIKDNISTTLLIYIVLYSFFIILLMYLFYRYRLKVIKQKHQKNLDNVLIEQKANALLMSPHFIFNALGNIQGFIALKETKKANEYLLKFSSVIRTYLNFMNEGIVTLDKEIESLDKFIEFQQIKHENNLDFSVTNNLTQPLNKIKIPAFVLQPFIENSIKYFKSHTDKMQINVEINSITNNSYQLIITDNGQGIGEEVLNKLQTLNSQNSDEKFSSLLFTLQRLKKIHKANKVLFDFKIENKLTENNVIEGLKVSLTLSTQIK